MDFTLSHLGHYCPWHSLSPGISRHHWRTLKLSTEVGASSSYNFLFEHKPFEFCIWSHEPGPHAYIPMAGNLGIAIWDSKLEWQNSYFEYVFKHQRAFQKRMCSPMYDQQPQQLTSPVTQFPHILLTLNVFSSSPIKWPAMWVRPPV